MPRATALQCRDAAWSSAVVIFFLLVLSLQLLETSGSLSARSLLAEDGCYADRRCAINGSTFELTYIAGNGAQAPDMTRRLCSVLAAARNFSYAAVQRGHICFGTNSVQGLQQAQQAQCDMPCNGNPDDLCGSYCVNSVFPVGGDTAATYTGWTDNTTASTAVLDENPQLCPPGHYITGWTFGWLSDQPHPAASKSYGLLQIQGNCSRGGPEAATVLLPAVGEHGDATELQYGPGSATGFTCATLQQGGVTELFAGASPGQHYVAGFLGEWSAKKGSQVLPWAICGAQTPPDWVAIGYERTTGDYIRAMRFILASRETLKREQLEQARVPRSPAPADPAAGCYADAPCLKDSSIGLNMRALTFLTTDNEDREEAMTRYKCATVAAASGYKYAALEFGSVCYGAGDELLRLQRAAGGKCNLQCLGSSEVCGSACYFSAYTITGIDTQYSARTDNRTDFKVTELRDSTQVCPEGEYITRWEIGTGPWNVTGGPRQLIYIRGYCSRGFVLLPASGSLEEYEDAVSVNSTSGFTCGMVQAGSTTQSLAPAYPTVDTVATFMGHGEAGRGLSTRPWTICKEDMPEDWVVVGYEAKGDIVVEYLRFLFAPRQLVHAIAPPIPTGGARQTNTTLAPQPAGPPAPAQVVQPQSPNQSNGNAAGRTNDAPGGPSPWSAMGLALVTLVLLH